jgi:hypothetical protein
MKLLRRFLGVLWTLVAGTPVLAPAESQVEAGTATVSAPVRAPQPESRPSLGAVRIGLGDTVLRDFKTPFVGAPILGLDLTTHTTRSDSQSVPPRDGQTARHAHDARAPPTTS